MTLTYVSSDPLDEDPLSPSHLLYGRTIVSLPYPVRDSSGSTKDLTHYSANKLYNTQSQCIQQFWSRWRKEFLTSLREYQRNGGHNEEMCVLQTVGDPGQNDLIIKNQMNVEYTGLRQGFHLYIFSKLFKSSHSSFNCNHDH